MDDPMAMEEHQTVQQLLGESSDELEREAVEVVGFDELVQVHAK